MALALLAPFFFVAMFHHIRFATISTTGGRLGDLRKKADLSSSALMKRKLSMKEMGKLAMLTNTAGLGMGGGMDVAAVASIASLAKGKAEEDSAKNSEAKALQVVAEQKTTKAHAQPAKVPAVAVTVATATATATVASASSAAASGGGATERDVAADYPPPTLSTKRLLDSSENWLPVPDAEGPTPSDLLWRGAIPAACKPLAGSDPTPTDSDSKTPKLGVTLPEGCTCPPGRRPYHTILTAQV